VHLQATTSVEQRRPCEDPEDAMLTLTVTEAQRMNMMPGNAASYNGLFFQKAMFRINKSSYSAGIIKHSIRQIANTMEELCIATAENVLLSTFQYQYFQQYIGKEIMLAAEETDK